MYLKAFFTKTTLWSVAAFCLLVGVFVYATIDRTVYVTEQLVVIPDTVVSDTWLGVENILVSDISGESLYQEFTLSNAAVLDEGLMNANPPAETSADNLPTAEVGAPTSAVGKLSAEVSAGGFAFISPSSSTAAFESVNSWYKDSPDMSLTRMFSTPSQVSDTTVSGITTSCSVT